MLVSTLKEDTINMKIVNRGNIENLEKDYYANIYVIKNTNELNTFYNNEGKSIDTNEKKLYKTVPENYFYLYIDALIPEGYKAYKRNNTQTIIDNKAILITDNLYYYQSKDDIYHLLIDVLKNNEQQESSFAFFYQISNDYIDSLTKETIRIQYNLTSKQL